jgi:hypothetical protein
MTDHPQPRTVAAVPLPLSPHLWATLTAALPLTEEEWDRLLAVLAAMRPAIVSAAPAPATTDREDDR